MGIEHLNSLGRNEPCWCQSGTKYKKCHLDADEAAHRASLAQASAASTAASASGTPAKPEAPANPAINRTLVATVCLSGLAALVLVTVLRDIGDGLIAGLAVILVGTGYAILRDPPPVHRDKAESTPTTFNLTPPSEAPATTTTRMVRGMTPPPPRTRRKPR